MESLKKNLMIIAIVLGLLTGLSSKVICYRMSGEVRSITVKDKESIATEDGHKYLIYCEGEVLSNEDSFSFLKFNSADVYNELEKGKTYKCKIAGWRVPLFSWTENIIEVIE